MKRLGLLLGFGASWTLSLWAAPVDLTAPPTVFDGVTEEGYFQMDQEMGTLDLGGNFQLPIRALFNSSQESSSPYFGRGWSCPFLESMAVPVNNTSFKIRLLCGKTMYLRQSAGDPKKFSTSSGGWAGTYDDGVLTVGRSDGWQLVYRQGHLAQVRTDRGGYLCVGK